MGGLVRSELKQLCSKAISQVTDFDEPLTQEHLHVAMGQCSFPVSTDNSVEKPSWIQLQLKITDTQSILAVQCNPSEMMAVLAAAIWDVVGIPPTQQRMKYNDTLLQWDRSLVDYGIPDGSEIVIEPQACDPPNLIAHHELVKSCHPCPFDEDVCVCPNIRLELDNSVNLHGYLRCLEPFLHGDQVCEDRLSIHVPSPVVLMRLSPVSSTSRMTAEDAKRMIEELRSCPDLEASPEGDATLWQRYACKMSVGTWHAEGSCLNVALEEALLPNTWYVVVLFGGQILKQPTKPGKAMLRTKGQQWLQASTKLARLVEEFGSATVQGDYIVPFRTQSSLVPQFTSMPSAALDRVPSRKGTQPCSKGRYR